MLSRRRAHLDERTARAAELVSEEVNRFEHLVSDLIELARGDQEPERSPVRMADLARQVCRSRGLPEQIVVCASGASTIWHVDPRRIRQVLVNLLDNAERHGGGTTALRLGNSGGLCYVEIDDEGPGVRPQDRQAIF